METLPIEYRLEFYEGSFENDASWTLQTSMPPPHFAVGDLLDHRTFSRWYKRPAAGETFRVKGILHFVWEVEKSHVGHTLAVCVEPVKIPG